VNRFADDQPVPPPPFAHDPGVERARAEFLRDWRGARSASAHAEALRRIETAARGSDNLLPPILAALTAHATLGEVCDALRGVFGTYHPGDRL